jgi:hypothetical protein
MNERLVEDWLTKANERSYQTPFAQSLLSDGMQVLRVAHSPHEHGKDIIAIDQNGNVHAYQLKDGDLDLRDLEKEFGQITALVETQVEHSAIKGKPNHQPWLVISGEISLPADDRIRAHNLSWRKRRFTPLKIIVGRQLLNKFSKMAANFWPQNPVDSNRLFNLYLTDGKSSLDLKAYAALIASITLPKETLKRADVSRRLSAANLFSNYCLAPFYATKNHWELVQGWTITAAHIAWVAEETRLAKNDWRPTFRLAVDAGIASLRALVSESLQPKAFWPHTFAEIDELTRSRCTICAGAISARVLISIHTNEKWDQEALAKDTIESLFSKGRLMAWGESAIPHFLAIMWAMDELRGDQFSDRFLFAALSVVANQNSGRSNIKLPSAYASADEANASLFHRLFNEEKVHERQASTSSSLESLVTIAARRMWRNGLSMFWAPITNIDLEQIVPDKPRDILLWDWGFDRGMNRTRKYPPTQSWRELLADSRRDESNSLPNVIKGEIDFAILFLLCFPHRLSPALVKFFEETF